MEGTRDRTFEKEEAQVAWEGLSSACASPVKRFGGFVILGFASFSAAITAVILFFHLFGERTIEGQAVSVPHMAFYITLGASIALTLGGFAIWMFRSLRAYGSFYRILEHGGMEPRHPTKDGLGVYSDEQLLSLRTRYERLTDGKQKRLLQQMFGFSEDDSFKLGPLSVLPGTFEMNALRVEWEMELILKPEEEIPTVTWMVEGRYRVLPRKLDDTLRLMFVLGYTTESVRMLKRRYGYQTDKWHVTVPDGKLWDAVRDHEQARRVQATLNRRMRG